MQHLRIKAGLAVIVLTLLGGVAAPVGAGEPEQVLEPGLWEVVTRPTFPGVPAHPLPKTDRFCLTSSDIAAGLIPVRMAPACKVLGGTYKGNQLELKIECADMPQASGKLELAGKTFTGRVETVAVPGQEGVGRVAFYYNHSGNWFSACPPSDGKTETPPSAK
ncbi:MAG: DUF3617 family protein [Sulfuricella sp.]|nr:DUF3617 family protein [Sulfuricella sp.]